MPVYNGEKYLERSINSVISQSFKDFELVCVDDSSTDNSFAVLCEYAKTDNRIIPLKKAHGGCVPKSWNYVFPKLKGKFIVYMSQDDFISDDYLSKSYKRYLETDADIILPNMILYYENNNTYSLSHYIYTLGDKVISGREAFELCLNGKLHGFGLYKSEIMKSEPFAEDLFNSDEYITLKNYLLSDKVAFSTGVFYYSQNENAISQKAHMRQFERLITNKMTEQLILTNISGGGCTK